MSISPPPWLCEELLSIIFLHFHLTNPFDNKIFALCRDSLSKQKLPCSHAFGKNLVLETGKY
jgi:hypothetical protein